MKKTLLLAAVGLLGLASCNNTVHNGTENNYYNVDPNSNKANNPPNPPNPADTTLNVIVKMNNIDIHDGSTYNVGDRTNFSFSWSQLKTGCEKVELTIAIYDATTGYDYTTGGIKAYPTDNFTINMYTDVIPKGCKGRLQWTIVPLKCSGKTVVEGKYYLLR